MLTSFGGLTGLTGKPSWVVPEHAPPPHTHTLIQSRSGTGVYECGRKGLLGDEAIGLGAFSRQSPSWNQLRKEVAILRWLSGRNLCPR